MSRARSRGQKPTSSRVYAPDAARDRSTVRLPPDEAHHLKNVLRMAVGDAVGVFDGTLTFNDETVAKNVQDAKDNRGKLWLLTVLPIILWIAGTLFIIAGVALLLLRRRGGRTPGETPPQVRELTGAST